MLRRWHECIHDSTPPLMCRGLTRQCVWCRSLVTLAVHDKTTTIEKKNFQCKAQLLSIPGSLPSNPSLWTLRTSGPFLHTSLLEACHSRESHRSSSSVLASSPTRC